MTVTLRDVVLAVGYGDASLVGESAGYLILGAADCAFSTNECGTLDSITISEEGAVKLAGHPVAEEEAEKALRGLLGALLKRVRIPSTNLERVAARADPRGLASLVTELEAALVPVNRRAARRTLARLWREAKKSAAQEREFAQVEEIESPQQVIAPPAPSPAPLPVAPAPAPPIDVVVKGEQAEQVVQEATRRPSQRPTVRAPLPHARALAAMAGDFGSQTPADSAPVVPVIESVDRGPDPFDEALGYPEPEVYAAEDEFDDAPTQVFLGVAPVPAQAAVEQSIPAPRRRRAPVVVRRADAIAEDESLIVMAEDAPVRRPSDIGELLDRMSVAPLATDELYVGLKSLSRVDVSPVAPPVGASWIDDGS